MVALFLVKSTTKGVDFFNFLSATITRFTLKLNNLSNAVTAGAPAMIIKNEGVIMFPSKTNKFL